MGKHVVELKLDPFVRCIALKIGLFETEIIDERNFGCSDEPEMLEFLEKYQYRNDYAILKIQM